MFCSSRVEFAELMGQKRSGAVLMNTTHEKDQTDQQGLYQGEKERKKKREKKQQLAVTKSTHEEDQTDQQRLYHERKKNLTNSDEEYTRGRSDKSTGTVSKKGDSVGSLYSMRVWIGVCEVF